MTSPVDDKPPSFIRATQRPLVIGVVNNMPEAAFQVTADQFAALLGQAVPDGTEVQVRLFCSPERDHADPVSRRHEAAQSLWTAALDGLIVTGAEPRAAHIADEPSQLFVARIVDWVEAGALPTMWSCLAAHAAVYHLDGLERRQRQTKLSGVFTCDIEESHWLVAGCAKAWRIPHSRLNDMSEDALIASGYQILTRSDDVGADTFAKEMAAPHVFLNGHPEYGAATLSAEYRRDVRRFLLGERADYPALPTGYFPESAVREMAAFRKRALARREPDTLADFPAIPVHAMPWRETAILLFRNWLINVAARRRKRAGIPDVVAASRLTLGQSPRGLQTL